MWSNFVCPLGPFSLAQSHIICDQDCNNQPSEWKNQHDHDHNIHLYYGVGGGLSVQLHGHAHDNTVVISNNYFDLNKANSGGGLTVDIKQNAGKNNVTVFNSLFYNNSADAYPGGGGAYTGIALYRQQDKAFNNSYSVRSD